MSSDIFNFILKLNSMRTFLFIMLLLSWSSCQEKVENHIPVESPNLDDCEDFFCKEISVDHYWPLYPTGIFITDENLIIKDENGNRRLFHVITQEGKLVQEFLEQGKGPKEFISSTFNSQFSDNHVLDVFDNTQKRIISYAKKENRFIFSSTFSSKKSNENICEMVNCGNYYLAMGENGRFKNNRFLVLDTLGNIIKVTGCYPIIQPDLLVDPKKDLQTMLFHTSSFRVSPNRQKAVFASYKGALIQFFDLSSLPDLVQKKSIQLERPKKKEQIAHDHEGWVYGFEDVYVTNDHVYAIYNGETAIDNPEFGRYILKYDWDGNLLKKYRSDMGIRCFAVDESSGTLFFISYINDRMKLFSGHL